MALELKLDLTLLHELQWVSHLDYYFAKTMAECFHEKNSLVLVSCALVSRALAKGHICLNLKQEADTWLRLPDPELCMKLPSHETWEKALFGSSMVAREMPCDPGLKSASPPLDAKDCPYPGNCPEKNHPLVLDLTGNLYLSRYYDFQKRLVANLCCRLKLPAQKIHDSFLAECLDPVFQGQDPEQVEKQKEAVLKALTHNFVLISGGPGTGKTHITALIQALLAQWSKACNQPLPKIISMAPTGKAASRLHNGATIHSILKPLKTRPGFVHTQDNPLNADVVIIDEASMVDIALMTRLLEAIPQKAKIILLGDKNQLSPVQAGAVFNDICQVRSMAPFLVFLEYNFRSQGKTGIENLAQAIQHRNVAQMESVLKGNQYPDIQFEPWIPGTRLDPIIEKHILKGYLPLAGQRELVSALGSLDRFRILCAHKKGESGTLQINHVCEKILRSHLNFDITGQFFKKIIMIRSNDYHKGLFNGDTGIVHEENKIIKAGFQDSQGQIRQYRYLDLPAHDTAFAVTIHKSQGSEFDTVLIIIPEKLSPIITRQLLYTGVTRARKKAIIAGSLDIIKEAMTLTLDKSSNIANLLEQRLGNLHSTL